MEDKKNEVAEIEEISDITKRVLQYANYQNQIYVVTFTDDLLISINKNTNYWDSKLVFDFEHGVWFAPTLDDDNDFQNETHLLSYSFEDMVEATAYQYQTDNKYNLHVLTVKDGKVVKIDSRYTLEYTLKEEIKKHYNSKMASLTLAEKQAIADEILEKKKSK